jgi:RNA polymerase sigma-70 factor (ECF subfamily)
VASNKRTAKVTRGAAETEIVARARAGDGDAFAVIVDTYRDRLFGLAVGIVRNRDAAEDIVQETFIKAYRNLAGFRGDAGIYTWLYRIAVNTAHNHLRRRRKGEQVDLEEVAPVIEADGPGPAEITANVELAEAIQTAVGVLPARQREVFMLHYFEQLTHREIAAVLGITEGAVKANFFHAVQKLKVSLAPYAS